MTSTRISLRFTMAFPSKVIGDPLIHTLSAEFKVVPNILRGRITDKGARLEVEITGAASRIQDAVKYLESRGVAIKPIEARSSPSRPG
jgi:ABC-type methionine transport system ATPase subunit